MKITVSDDINGLQEARRLKMVLEHYQQSDIVDKPTQLLIESLLNMLNEALANPKFADFDRSSEIETIRTVDTAGSGLRSLMTGVWRWLSGPTRREQVLARQRQELIERAERAEAMAFEALAETNDVARQRDEAVRKIELISRQLAAVKQPTAEK